MSDNFLQLTKTFPIYFQDLTEDCQKRLYDFLGGENGNYDVFPICTLEVEDETNERDI